MAKELFNRYVWLIDMLQRYGRLTRREIDELWMRSEYSGGRPMARRTFMNYRQAIQEMFDVNIECDSSTYEYYIEDPEALEGSGARVWALNTLAVNSLLDESQELRERIVLENIPSGQKFLRIVFEAMRENRLMSLSYRSFRRVTASHSLVAPYFVRLFRQRWYMIARNIYNNSMRVYALDRILGLLQTGHIFTMPQDFDPEEYFYNSFGVIKQDNCPPEIIELKVYGTKREYIRSLPLHHSQEEIESGKDWAVFRYYVAPTYDFIQEILSHGYEVEIIAPAHLKEEIRWQAAIVASR